MNLNDYRRGRQAVALLAGRRTDVHRLPSASTRGVLPYAVLALVLIAGLGVAVMRNSLAPQSVTETMQGPSAAGNDARADPVAGGSSRDILPGIEVRFATWDEAQSAVEFDLKQPTWLPDGYRMSALQAFVIVEGQTPIGVVATFDGPAGEHFSFYQDVVTRPDEFQFEESVPSPPPGIAHGRVLIGTSLGYWMNGVSTADDAGEPVGWDSSVTVVAWQAGDVVYQIHAVGIDLAALIRMAESVR